MTSELSVIVKKYYAVLKDERNIPIDDLDKATIEDLKASNRFSAFIQIGSGKDKFNGEVSMIQEIKEVRVSSIAGAQFICDFGNRHPVKDRCDCNKKYGIDPGDFRSRMFETFPTVLYAQNLTHEQRKILVS